MQIKTCGVIILSWKLSLEGSQTGLTFGIACKWKEWRANRHELNFITILNSNWDIYLLLSNANLGSRRGCLKFCEENEKLLSFPNTCFVYSSHFDPLVDIFFCWNSLNWRKGQLKLQIRCESFSMQIQMNSSWVAVEFMIASETLDQVSSKI
jgi:hypothetical protein